MDTMVSIELQNPEAGNSVFRLYPFEKVQLRQHGGSHQFYSCLIIPLGLLKQEQRGLIHIFTFTVIVLLAQPTLRNDFKSLT